MAWSMKGVESVQRTFLPPPLSAGALANRAAGILMSFTVCSSRVSNPGLCLQLGSGSHLCWPGGVSTQLPPCTLLLLHWHACFLSKRIEAAVFAGARTRAHWSSPIWTTPPHTEVDDHPGFSPRMPFPGSIFF